MANLLPAEYQARQKSALYARLVLAASLALLFGAVFTLLAFMPAYIEARYGFLQNANIAAASSTPTADDQAAIGEAKTVADQLFPLVAATTTPSDAIRAALSKKPSGISVDHLTYTAIQNGEGQLVLSGVSKNPDTVGAYRDLLAKNPLFKNVSVPVGALVGAKDGRFSVTLVGQF